MAPAAKPLVLFDVDGTLLLTTGAGMRAMKKAAADLFGATFRWYGIVVADLADPTPLLDTVRHLGTTASPR